MTKKKVHVQLLDGRKDENNKNTMGLTSSSSSASSPLTSGGTSLTSPVSFSDVIPTSSTSSGGGGVGSGSSSTNRHYAVHDVVGRKLPVHASSCGMCYAVQWEGYTAPREATWEYRNNLVHAHAATPKVANVLVSAVDRGHKKRVNHEVAEWGNEKGLHTTDKMLSNKKLEQQKQSEGGLQTCQTCDRTWSYANTDVQSSLLDPVSRRWYTRDTTPTPILSGGEEPIKKRTGSHKKAGGGGSVFDAGIAPPTPLSILTDALPSLMSTPSSHTTTTPLLGVALLIKEATVDEQQCNGVRGEEGHGEEMDGADSNTTTTTYTGTNPSTTLSSLNAAVYEWIPLGESGSFSNTAQIRNPHTIAESILAPTVTHTTSVKGLTQDHERRTASILKHIGKGTISAFAAQSGVYTDEEATELCCNQVFGHSVGDMKRLVTMSDKVNNWAMWGGSDMGALVSARRAEPLLCPPSPSTTASSSAPTTHRIKIVSLVPGVEKLEWARFGNSFTAPLPMNRTAHHTPSSSSPHTSSTYSSAASLLTSHMDEVLSAEFMNFRWAAHVDKDDKLLSEVVSDLDERQLFSAMTKRCMDMAATDESAMRHASTATTTALEGGSEGGADAPPKRVRVLRLLGRKAARDAADTQPITNTQGPKTEPISPTTASSPVNTTSPTTTTNTTTNVTTKTNANTPHMRPFWDRMGLEETFTDPLSSSTDVLFYAPPSEELFRMPLSVLRVHFEQELIDFLLERSSILF